MKLLLLTQKVDRNDDILGFVHGWISEFAKHYEKITVICLYEGGHTLPSNVEVLSLGKEKGVSKFTYIYNFYRYIFTKQKEYDAVFVHMNPIYVVLGGLWWKCMGKKIYLWYTHKRVDLKLRIAELFVHKIFSASKESFRLKTPKLSIPGHAIDTDLFVPPTHKREEALLLTVGRISSIKQIHELVTIVHFLAQENMLSQLAIVGGPITKEDELYLVQLREKVIALGLANHVIFVGSLPYRKILPWFQKATVFVNVSNTGSVDKVVLEAMSTGLPVVTSNEAFASSEYGNIDGFYYSNSMSDIREALKQILSTPQAEAPSLREYVITTHGLNQTISKLVEQIKV